MRGGDFAGGVCVGGGLAGAARARRVISATGIQPELLRRHSMERGCSPTVLRGSSAEVSSDDLPVVGGADRWRCRMTTCVGILAGDVFDFDITTLLYRPTRWILRPTA
jgi:hypothetical protein